MAHPGRALRVLLVFTVLLAAAVAPVPGADALEAPSAGGGGGDIPPADPGAGSEPTVTGEVYAQPVPEAPPPVPLDVTPPEPPAGLQVEDHGLGRRLHLTWQPSPSEDVALYRVYRDDGGGRQVVTEIPAGGGPAGSVAGDVYGTRAKGSTFKYTDKGLVDGRSYSYWVVAVDAAGNESPVTGPVSASPSDRMPPEHPHHLKGEDTKRGHEIRISWAPNTTDDDLAGFLVYRAEAYEGPYRLVTPRPIRETTYLDYDPTLEHGKWYYYTVMAVDETGNETEMPAGTRKADPPKKPPKGAAYYLRRLLALLIGERVASAQATGGEVIQVMATDATPPSDPMWVLAKPMGGGTLGVNWRLSQDQGGMGSYRVEVREFSGGTWGPWQPWTTVAQDSTWQTGFAYLTGLKSSTRYQVRVVGIDLAGNESAPSSTAGSPCPCDTTTDRPAAIDDVTATAGPGGVTLTWTAGEEPNLQGYRVFRADRSDPAAADWVLLTPTPVPHTPGTITYTDASALEPYRNYYYRVVAVDSTGAEGVPSRDVYARMVSDGTNTAPHVAYTNDTVICATCHQAHSGQSARMLRAASEPLMCFVCHDGTGSKYIVKTDYEGYSGGSRHPVPEGRITCTSCHNPHLNYQDPATPKLLDPHKTGKNKGVDVCYECHGVGSTLVGGDHQTAFEQSIHRTNIPDPPSGTQIKCLGCHLPHGSANTRNKRLEGENVCFECHSPAGSGIGAPNIFQYFAWTSSYNTRHDVFRWDQEARGSRLECTNCHNPHRASRDRKLIEPHSPGPDNAFDSTQPNAIITFCTRCHDNTFPTDAQTSPYTTGVSPPTKTSTVEGPSRNNPPPNGPLTNVSSTYSTNDMHGWVQKDRDPKLDPRMGWGFTGDNGTPIANEVLPCTACHDPHGSANEFNLRVEVRSKDGTLVRRGLVYRYGQGKYDFRYFCVTCHQVGSGQDMGFDPDQSNGGRDWPNVRDGVGCIACHHHGGDKF